MTVAPQLAERKYLGIEGGGTRTVALLADSNGKLLKRLEAGAANLKLVTNAQLTRHLQSMAESLPQPDGVAIGLAGAWTEKDRERIKLAAGQVWRGISCYATNDLETAFMAATNGAAKAPGPRVLIVSGTGSCCYGKTSDGVGIKVGGWGHVLGDKGSGYEIGLRALKAVVYYYDREGVWSKLGGRLLRALQLNEPTELIDWALQASKTEIASLAVEVFQAWERKEKIANDILAAAANSLARDADACARRVCQDQVSFVLGGSLLLKQPRFAALVIKELRKFRPGAQVEPLRREGVWGAVELAKLQGGASEDKRSNNQSRSSRAAEPVQPEVRSSSMSPTEQRNPRSMNLDKLKLADAIELMLSEEAGVVEKLRAERAQIESVVRAVAFAFKRGGRLFYIGSGTSGRLGVLDASECPPTFRTPGEMVQGIIAGGETALRNAVEGAEDDTRAGAAAIRFRNVSTRDVVIGIAASGTTPFVWGALGAAKAAKAFTVLIAFNPFLTIPSALKPKVIIAANLGPEVLTGSTRLKAGTATKLLLNIITTLAMVRTGKVMSNLMIDLLPANIKLRDRASRMVQELTGADAVSARAALERNQWVIKKAVAQLSRK